MPQIPEFTAQSPGITAPETGVEAFAQAGRRIGMFYHQTGQNISGAVAEAADHAQKFIDHQEISHGAVGYAGLLGEFTDDWNNTLKEAIASGNANDPTIAGRFRAKWEDKLQKFTENFQTDAGQKWAEAHVDMLRNHIFEQTTAGMSTLAGISVAPNIERMVNTWANAARANPSLVPDLVRKDGIIDNSIGAVVGSAPNLKAEDAARITNETAQKAKERAVAGGAHGKAENGADEAEMGKYTQSFGQYIPQPGMADEMVKLARSYKRAAEFDQDRLKRLEDQRVQDESTDRRDDYIKDWYGQTPTKTLRDVISDETLTQGDREHLIGVYKNLTKPEAEAHLSHETWTDLMGQIRTGMTDDGPIWDALKNHTLNKADFDDLRRELDARKTPEGERLARAKDRFLKGVESQIVKTLPSGDLLDPEAKERFYELQWELDRKMDEYRRAGKDPYLLIDPSKPDYMGNKEALKPYTSPLSQQMRQTIEKYRGTGNILPGGGTITGTETINVPPGQKPFAPPANWQWNPRRQQYRDPQGNLYDPSGKPVANAPAPSAAPPPLVPISR